jgi:23S rRNA (uracil1939-C5)-methyltransferase
MPSVTVERPAYGGYSIGRMDGGVLFVRGAIPGETVGIRIDEQKKSYSFCTAIDILSPSADRVQPECEYFGNCGGCQLQFIAYNRQVCLKEETLLDSVMRGAKTDITLSSSIFDGNSWGYRHRGQFKIAGSSIGFFREKTRDVVDINCCPLMIPEINNLLSRASDLLKSDQKLFQGISELHISYGDSGIALLKTGGGKEAFQYADRIVPALLDAGFRGVCVEPDHGKLLWRGARHTIFDLGGLKYSVSPQTFFQGHWRLNCRVVQHIREGLQPLAGKKILDLYSGAGNFALPLALEAQEVIAVEEGKSAIADGKTNASLNNIKNCRFIKSAAEDFHEALSAHAIILDPPRLGLSNNVVNKALALEAERIVYVSCNPSTFARDLKKLLVKYKLESLRLIDFFPQTYHIESVAFLGLR